MTTTYRRKPEKSTAEVVTEDMLKAATPEGATAPVGALKRAQAGDVLVTGRGGSWVMPAEAFHESFEPEPETPAQLKQEYERAEEKTPLDEVGKLIDSYLGPLNSNISAIGKRVHDMDVVLGNLTRDRDAEKSDGAAESKPEQPAPRSKKGT